MIKQGAESYFIVDFKIENSILKYLHKGVRFDGFAIKR